jgi:hypothetical protein
MAGVKVTDLTTLATAANDDIMYIVDTSSNTSKQIEVQNLYDGMPQFESGTFTPVPSGENDCTVTIIGDAIYSRVNNVVTISYYLSVQMDGGINTGSFNISMPVSSNFGNARQAFGVLTPITNALSELDYYVISADTTFDQITFEVDIITAGNSIDFVANIQYLVI